MREITVAEARTRILTADAVLAYDEQGEMLVDTAEVVRALLRPALLVAIGRTVVVAPAGTSTRYVAKS